MTAVALRFPALQLSGTLLAARAVRFAARAAADGDRDGRAEHRTHKDPDDITLRVRCGAAEASLGAAAFRHFVSTESRLAEASGEKWGRLITQKNGHDVQGRPTI